MTTELERLAERCEKHAISLVSNAFGGFDTMRHGKQSLRDMLDEAANTFTVAAALRSRSVRGEE